MNELRSAMPRFKVIIAGYEMVAHAYHLVEKP